ncbi:fimbria/pilus outer membrane usher protein [Escherichia coli]|uniref:fimbria/pilus outer membrane usher protein n=1 Tax=Escherichia coli TaxID=562 RepID=UPI000BE98868|nr:fimbria/pilus outer membrane usher protein [Escherichia coli]EKK6907450.1 fimbrial biogenesis outer membrane usher protein [Shigella sonnei]EKK6974097.1 fimbrial biogenesis outer membrane usher protein [Shigella sonnei]MCN7410153.1 fimbrial biogenesis outer membrane usher protein [Escherichia coli]HEF4968102.1 fimbrial biogenesis outer membrane usher protein [Escherichia coli]
MQKKFLAVWLFFFYSPLMEAKQYTFDTNYFNGDIDRKTLNLINKNESPPGDYVVDVFINGQYLETRKTLFKLRRDSNLSTKIVPDLGKKDLEKYGVKQEFLKKDKTFYDYSRDYQDWNYDYDFYQQRLNLVFPEKYLNIPVDGIHPTEQWDNGISALYINYDADINNIIDKKSHSSYDYLYSRFESGINIGPWRIRNEGYIDKGNERKIKWNNLNNYAERGLNGIHSRLTIGDSFSNSVVFESIPFRGVMLGTEESMYPERYYNFSPVIKGVVKTHALVTVESNGSVIYSNSFSAGSFAITDLPSLGIGSILKVTIKESDGTIDKFYVPYSPPPIALKEGFTKYNLIFGKYRANNVDVIGQGFLQGILMYGLPYGLTAYNGMHFSNGYQAIKTGISSSLGDYGAISFDVAHSNTKHSLSRDKKGNAYNFKYYKDLFNTNSSFSFNYFKSDSRGYSSITDDYNEVSTGFRYKSESIASVSVNQSLGAFGNFQYSFNREKSWFDNTQSNNSTLSYNADFMGNNLSLSFSSQKIWNNRREKFIYLNLSVPFGEYANTNGYFYTQTIKTHQGYNSSIGVNGLNFDNKLSWDVNTSSGNITNKYIAANVNWAGPHGNRGGMASINKYNQQYSLRMDGSTMISQYGVTFGQKIGSTSALIVVPDGKAISITNNTGVQTDSDGLAVLGGLMPFKENIISLNPLTTPGNVEVLRTDIKVVPTRGAIVASRFNTLSGNKIIAKILKKDGSPVPLGSVVSLSDNINAGIVGEDGEVFLVGLPQEGTLIVTWGGGDNDKCNINYKNIAKKSFPVTIFCGGG